MTCDIFSAICGGDGPELPRVCCDGLCLGECMQPGLRRLMNRDNAKTPCQLYQQALTSSTADILIYVHDDVEIYDPAWLQRVLNLFENQNCAVVGLGGAPGLGHESLYKRPYTINQLARQGYVSNQTDYDIHGGLLEGDIRVAVVEQFFMAIRRSFLLKIGGWPVEHLSHHGLDMFIACEAAKHGYDSFACGCRCLHKGGQSSTSEMYRNAKWLQGGNMIGDHQRPHRWLYDSYRQILPIVVKP